MHYFLNYSGEAQTFPYAYGGGADVLNGKVYAKAASMTLQPWDLAIIEEK